MVTVARQANSRVGWLVTNMLHTQLHYYSGQIVHVHSACEQVEHGYNDPQDRNLIALYSTDLKLVSMVHGLHAQWIMRQVGHVDAAYAEIVQRAQALEHPYSLAWAWTWGALVYLHDDQPERLLPCLQNGLALAQSHGFAYVSAMATFALGWCQTRLGHPDEGIKQMEAGLMAFEATGAGIVLPFFLALLGEAMGRAGRKAEGLECLAQAWARTEQGGERWHEAELHRIRGDLLASGPEADPAQARLCYMQALAVAQTQGAQAWARRADMALAAMPR
jgi:predicted ATPase